MSDKTHEVKESRIKELAEECPDYKKAMEVLFPEAFEEREENITPEIEWRLEKGLNGGCFLWGDHKGQHIAFVNPTHDYQPNEVGVRILDTLQRKYKVEYVSGHTFKIIKTRR